MSSAIFGERERANLVLYSGPNGATSVRRCACVRIIASHVYNISIVEQCIYLDSTLGTHSTAYVLSNTDMSTDYIDVETAVKT